jgi:5-(carboxyamino)imidazole ribonucleotide synthase
MTAMAAVPLGCEVVVLEKAPFSPASSATAHSMVGDWSDRATLMEFAGRCDVVTLENEFVDAGALALLEEAGCKVFPGSQCIALAQDKLTQKRALEKAGLAVPKFRAVNAPEELSVAAEAFGWPLLLKTRRNGYDGKGNFTLLSEADIEAGWKALGGGRNALFVEAFFHFSKELAVIVTRARDGSSVVYPVVETIQKNHVCHCVKAPAPVSASIAERAAVMAVGGVEAVGGIGSFGVELFLAADGELAINELAPRVHNSGHYTIEACECSQFENHVRAVLGWPLGSPRMRSPASAMVNLLGVKKAPGQPLGLGDALRHDGAHVHIYGKAMSDAGRKMGHVTAVGDSIEDTLSVAERAAKEIYFGDKS